MNTSDIKLYELYDIWYTPVWRQPWFKIGLGIVGLMVLCLVVFAWFKKKSRPKIKEPWQEALDSLYAINLKLFEEPEHHRMLYQHITAILKKYIGTRYSLDLASKTDHECLVIVAQSTFPSDLLAQLKSIMESAVTIKFAHQEAVMEHMRLDLLRSMDIVRNTIPQRKN